MPGPWDSYKKPADTGHPALLYRAPAKPATPPSGYAPVGNAPPLAYQPGGPNDPAQAARLAAAEAAARAAASNPYEINQIGARAQAQVSQQAQQNRLPLSTQQRAELATQMRKELEGRTSVQVYKNALPSYASALRSPDTPAGDQDMIYAYAKIMDPNSAVREGEAASVADLGTLGQKIAGDLRKQLDGSGKFTPELRAQLRNTLANRVGQYDKAYNMDRTFFKANSEKQGIDPDIVVGPHLGDAYAAVENQYFRHDPNKSAAAARAEAAQAAQGGNGTPSGPLPGADLATGDTHSEQMDPKTAGLITSMIKNGYTADQMNKALVPAGLIGPQGFKQADIDKYQKTLAAGGSLAPAYEKPNSLLNKVASSPFGVGFGAAADAGMGGLTDELTATGQWAAGKGSFTDLMNAADAKKQAAYSADPWASGFGKVAGNIGAMALGGGLLKGTALATSLGKPAAYIGATGYGALEGGGQNNDNRVFGAGTGALAAGAGFPLGELASIPVNAALRTRPGMAFSSGLRNARAAIPKVGQYFDNSTPDFAARLTPGEGDAARAFEKTGPAAIKGQLDEAARLGLPFNIADTSPEARELVAAGVRKSPTAAQYAENTLLSRNRGQVDRFGNAVARDLGPVENVPQLSSNLGKSAKSDAAPLYEKSYSAGQVDDPAINMLLQHPELQPILKDAQQLHSQDVLLAKARGEIPPSDLVPVMGPNGEYTAPDVRTIDYIQRALRNKVDAAYSGDAAGKMSAPFLKDARNLILARTDKAVPDFAAARAAYGGPMQSKDALEFGVNSLAKDPQSLGVELSDYSGEQLGQAALGQRSGLINRANSVRDTSNPWEATIGNPNARARIDTLHQNNPGTDDLFRSLELERQMQRTSNDILGNSKTAQRQIADQAFLGPKMDAAVDIGSTIATGGYPVLPMAKMGFAGVKNVLKLGADKRAVAKAEELAPMLLNSDPAAAAGTVDDIMKKLALRQAFEQRQNLTRPMGMFGASVGAAVPNAYRPF